MRIRSYITPIVALFGALCIPLLLTIALLTPTPRRYDLGAPGDAYVVRNFYGPEESAGATFRWSGPDAALLLPDPYAGAAVLTARLHGNPDRSPVSLYGGPGAGRVAALQPTAGWRIYRVLAPRSRLWDAGGQPAEVRISVDPGAPRPGDPRDLGVAIDYLHVRPIAGEPVAPLVPLRAALLLSWGGLILMAAVWLAVRSLRPLPTGAHGSTTRPDTIPQRALAGFALFLTLSLALWAWRDPDSLRWALPLQWPWLAAASSALPALWAATRPDRPIALNRRRPGANMLITSGIALLAHLLLVLPLGPQVRGLAALVILGMPGALLARLLLRDEPDRLAQIFYGLCGALALPILLLMALQLIPGPLSPWLLLLLCDAQSALVGWVLWRRSGQALDADAGLSPQTAQPAHNRRDRRALLPLGLIMLLGAGLRLPFLGSAELHDDEATAITAAARLVAGQADQLLIQLKGPAQVLLPAGPMALTGQASELVARMPFALAGLGVILGGYLLLREMQKAKGKRQKAKGKRQKAGQPVSTGAAAPLREMPNAGQPVSTGTAAPLIVALLLALDGFLIAFARVVQYQSVVMVMGLGAALCCWRFYAGRGRSMPLLSAAAVMMAVALLGHYDAIYIMPALAWLVLAGGRRRGWGAAQWLRALAPPVAIGAVLLGSFYVPFVRHPHFSEVAAHLGERSGQDATGWALYNNLGGSAFLAGFYHTTPLLWAVGGGLAATLAVATAASVRPRPLGLLLAGLILLVAADLLRGAGGSLLIGAPGPVALLCALPLLGLLLAPATPAALRFGLIWFGSAAVPMSFLLAQPRTHMHVIDIPSALLVGWGLAAMGRRAARRRRRWPGAALALAAAALLAVATPYAYALFVRQSPKYQRGFPMAWLAAYPARAADRAAEPIGGNGRLGYPSQDGWKTVGELYRRGVLRGAFASNQSVEVTAWYTRGMRRCGAAPVYQIIAGALRNPAIPADAFLFATVSVHGQHQLFIYSRSRPAHPPYHFDSADFADAFDAQPLPMLPPEEAVCAQG